MTATISAWNATRIQITSRTGGAAGCDGTGVAAAAGCRGLADCPVRALFRVFCLSRFAIVQVQQEKWGGLL